ncbi:MAG: hypothetical protein IPJ30_22685 [Acidobacteria bacterium]|nr:hypothetical protein [Acidobacteriota bacterium]
MKLLNCLFLVGLTVVAIDAQVARRLPDSSPLDAVFHILSQKEADSNGDEKACLARSMARSGRFSEVEPAAQLLKPGSYRDELLAVVEEMLVLKRVDEAGKFVSYLIKRAGEDDFPEKLVPVLIRLGRDREALNFLESLEPDIDDAIPAIDEYLKLGKPDSAYALLKRYEKSVTDSKYPRDRSKYAVRAARIGKIDDAKRFAELALTEVDWSKERLEFEYARIVEEAVEVFALAGDWTRVDELIKKAGEDADVGRTYVLASIALRRNEKSRFEEFRRIIESTKDPTVYDDTFELDQLFELYLGMNDLDRSEAIAGKLTGNDHLQQSELMMLADRRIKIGDHARASELLELAFAATSRIDTSEAESGRLWTSGKWRQAQYRARIAVRYIDMRRDKRVLEIIRGLSKPYLKALALTEFVAVSRGRKPNAELRKLLDDAHSLVRTGRRQIFDSNRYDVYAIIARQYAQIGLPAKANEVFSEVLSLDDEMYERGGDDYLLIEMCNIGTEFERSGIVADGKVRQSLRRIIEKFDKDEY